MHSCSVYGPFITALSIADTKYASRGNTLLFSDAAVFQDLCSLRVVFCPLSRCVKGHYSLSMKDAIGHTTNESIACTESSFARCSTTMLTDGFAKTNSSHVPRVANSPRCVYQGSAR